MIATVRHATLADRYDIVVDPAHRGAGVGRMRLDATFTALATKNAPHTVLSTADRNEAAQRPFTRAGSGGR